MEFTPDATLPPIAGVGDPAARPRWSVMIPTYNCADTLERTLRSVLDQDPGPVAMQIEVVDDCSTRDDPEAVVRKVAGSRVAFARQPRNGGHVHNFNACLNRAQGRLVHILHGDDWVKDGFYSRLETAFEANPSVGAAFSRSIYVDHEDAEAGLTDLELEERGVIDDWFARILSRQRVCTPSMVVRRDVYENLGGFDPSFTTAGEDWEMWVRIAAHYPVWYEPDALACYRMSRPGSLTGNSLRTTRVVREMRRACRIIENRLRRQIEDRKLQPHLTQARLFYADWSLNYAQYVIRNDGVLRALPNLTEAFLCSPSPWMARRISRLVRRLPVD
ncbi:MAG TPA: glycosyltransferase [Novosphingobium sp.]|nr:glycosyltransferase [Novosphingobium sp.]